MDSEVVKIDVKLSRKVNELVETIKDGFGNPVFHTRKEFVDAAIRTFATKIEAEAKIVKKEQIVK